MFFFKFRKASRNPISEALVYCIFFNCFHTSCNFRLFRCSLHQPVQLQAERNRRGALRFVHGASHHASHDFERKKLELLENVYFIVFFCCEKCFQLSSSDIKQLVFVVIFVILKFLLLCKTFGVVFLFGGAGSLQVFKKSLKSIF